VAAEQRWSRTPRLDQPLEARRTLIARPQVDSEAFARFAERFARFMGTARFLVYMTVFVVCGCCGTPWRRPTCSSTRER
jgi:uncharacterized membrane protein